MLMAKVHLTQSFIKTATCPAGRKKMEYFDTVDRSFSYEVRTSGEGSYYQRYRDQRGRLRQIRIGRECDLSLAEARKLAREIRRKVALGEDPLAEKRELRSGITFAQFIIEQYLPFIKSYKRSWQTDVSILNNWLTPRFGDRYLDEISRQDIIRLMADRSATKAAPGSVNRLLIMMRYIFNLIIRWEVAGITVNPTRNIPLLPEGNRKERYLKPDEARKLHQAVCKSANKVLAYIVQMLVLTGARKREVLDARWEDFDFDNRRWRIPTTKAGKPRHVPLSDGAISVLNSAPRINGCPWVFANPDTQKPFVSIFAAWDTARRRVGLADVRIHDLRHSFASLLINSGRSLYEVQKLLGHTQIKTTQRYAHLAPETLLDASNAATRAIGSLMGVMPNQVSDVPLLQVQS